MSSNQRFSLVPRSVGLLLAGTCVAGIAGVAGVVINTNRKAPQPGPQPVSDSLAATIQRRPLTFEINQGQADESVRFFSRGSGYSFFLTKNESVLALAKLPKMNPTEKAPAKEAPAAVLRMRLADSNPNPKVVGEDRQPGYSNYFIGRNKKNWRTNVPNFGRVRYKDVYPGIDLAYYGNQRQLEHDFILKPGTDPKKIRLSYAGAKKITISKEGELVFHTATGVVEQKAPFSYQKVGTERKPVASRYVMLAKNEVGFSLGEYDHSKPLVIDPVLRYSRYIGGSIDEYPFAVTVDTDRNAYITGYTGSFDQPFDGRPGAVPVAEGGPYGNIPQRNPFPVTNPLMNDPDRRSPGNPGYDLSRPTNGSIDGVWYFSRYDAFITKVNANGSIVYSTYLGAEGDDYGFALAIDQSRNIYVTGQTDSLFWPQVFALQGTTNNGGNTDGFAVKLNAAGNNILYSTYLGGSGNERGRAIAVDGTGNAYIAGITTSQDFPTFARAGATIAQPQYGGGANDAFLISLNASGSAFNYATYLGGTGTEEGVSTNFGAALNSGLHYTYRAPNYEILIPLVGNGVSGAAALGVDWTVALAVDSRGNAVVAGGTSSTDFPTTTTAVQSAKDVGYDGFITQFLPSGNINYSTYLGGDGDDAVRSIAFGPNQEIVTTGYTFSRNFPTSPPTVTPPALTPAFQASNAGAVGTCDAFVTKLDAVGQLGTPNTYSTYLGGNSEDIGNGVIVSAGGQAYVTGSTSSGGNTFPTSNPYQTNLRGGRDVFATKYRPNGSEYEYSTYIGGLSDDRGMAIAVDIPGGPTNVQAYIAGFSRSTTYPTTLGGFDNQSFIGADFTPAPELIVTKLHAPPFAASGLSLTDIQLRSVDLAWVDNSDNEDGFEIERKLGAADSANLFAVVGVVGAGQVTFQDTNNVIPTTTYTYRVRAFNQETIGGAPQTFYGAYSNQLTVTTLPELPADASNLRVTSIDTSRLRLDWNDNSNNEAGFRIERASETTLGSGVPGTFQEVVTTAPNVITFTDTGLTPDTLYFYRLFTFNAAGETLPLGPVSGRTLPLAPQVAPTNLTARAVSSNQVDLAWNFPVNNTDPDGFKIERSNDAGRSYLLIRITTKQPGVPAGLTLSDTGVSGGSVYRYRVYAYNRSGDGPISATNDATVLVAPSNLLGTIASTTEIDLTWVDNSLAEDGYIVERSTNGGTSYSQIATLAANVESYNDLTVQPDGIYVYRVYAFKDTDAQRDVSTPTNLLNITALPPAPTMDRAHALDSDTVQIDFVDNSTTETGFTIERDSGSGFTAIAAPAQVGPSAGTGLTVSYLDNTVTAETTYTYRVRTTNASGNSLASTTDIAKVLAAPTNLAAAPTSTQVTLTWTDNSALNDNYVVERSRNGAPYAILTDSLGPNVTTYDDTTITLDSVYTYRVKASASTDDFSDAIVSMPVTTPPGAPSNVVTSATDSNTMVITWRDNSSTETSFRIVRSAGSGPFTSLVTGLSSLPGSGSTGTYTDTTVVGEETYRYQVIAVNGAVESTPSSASAPLRVLAAPSNLVVATATSRTQLTIQFRDNSSFETGFSLQRAPETSAGSGVAGTFANVPIAIGPSAGNTGTVTATDTTGLTPATRYFYRVRATAPSSLSSYSNVDDEDTLPNPPTAPTGLSLVVVSKSSIQLTWTDTADNEDGFRVKRSTDGSVYTTLPNIIPASPNINGVVTFDDNSVVEDTVYFYKVFAFNRGGNSADTAPASATTPPKAPTNLTATLLARNAITVTFRDNSVTEADFVLERSDDLGNTYGQVALVNAAAGSGSTVTHLDSTVLPDKQYNYRVRARNSGGSSSNSNTDSEFTPPADPSNIRLSGITNTSITVFWNDNSVTETQFVVERSTAGAAFVEIARVGPGVNTYLDSGLQGFTEYTYRVKATNGAPFDSNYTQPTVTGRTLPNPPATPQNLTVTAVSQTMLILRWDTLLSNQDGIKIERSLDGQSFTQITTVAADVREYVDSPLNVGTRYWYRVRAFNAGGNSAYSNQADAATFPPVPSGPSALIVTTVAPNAELRLRWTDNSNNEQEFIIERSLNGVTFVEHATTGAPNVTSFSDTNLQHNTTYHYRVRSSNQGGMSGPSNAASGLTLPAAPTNVTAVAQSGGSVRVNWTASTGGADGYIVFFVSQGQTAEAGRTGSGITQFVHSGLLPNRSFRYFVRAFNRSGSSTDSSGVDVTTSGVGVTSFTLSKSQIKGGKTVNGTVTLSGVAPAGGAVITIQATGDGATAVKPITLTIAAGQTTGTVKIKTKKVKRTTTATLTASYNGASAQVVLTIAK